MFDFLRSRFNFLAIIVFFLFILGGQVSFAIVNGSNANIDVRDAWARVSFPGVPNSAFYMVLHNKSDEAEALVSVSGKVSETIELHTMIYKDGMMSMKKVDNIVIPKKGKTELKPGGLHVMLIGLSKKLESGDKIKFDLSFKNSKDISIVVPVRSFHMKMSEDKHYNY